MLEPAWLSRCSLISGRLLRIVAANRSTSNSVGLKKQICVKIFGEISSLDIKYGALKGILDVPAESCAHSHTGIVCFFGVGTGSTNDSHRPSRRKSLSHLSLIHIDA